MQIIAGVTFHCDLRRLSFLAEVLRSLAEYPIVELKVIVVTNTTKQDEFGILRRLCGEIASGKVVLRSHPHLARPYDLAWCHKTLIAEEFLEDLAGEYTH